MSVATAHEASFFQFARILRSSHMTAIVVTENSEYVVIARPEFGVTVVRPNGQSLQGAHLAIEQGFLVLRSKRFTRVLTTSTVVRIEILTN